ncbi:transglutaminase family protein [Thalassoroseus pseudoceratinae]|uniref:transglutaminase family protein n=1 Tax=Thalassoroseus pseudoceratinae TaxID=2713176 RepID=UPI0014213045|nr:transglutaminase family protein [Thalassoroseus pseudoceratinae]
MPIHVALNHRTSYSYDRLISLSPHVVRLRPAPHCRTPILNYSLKIEPEPHFINWQQDPFGNYQARLVFPEKTRKFSVEVDLKAEMVVINPFDFFVEDYAEEFPFEYDEHLREDLRPFLRTEDLGPELTKFLETIDRTPRRTAIFLVDLNQQLEKLINYTIRMEPGVQTPEETLTKKSGSCRDTSWLLVQVLRHCGLAARFVSGYLIQLTADEKPLEGPAGPTADFTDLHAWAEVYLPGAGWVGLDPTSGLFAGEGHIPLACTPAPSSAAPIEGGLEECETEFDFAMEIQRVHEDPRVTKPYTEEQWEDVLKVGQSVDERLKTGDVRLTMGGEPTFVSIDDMEGDEWNIAAVGPMKRQLAEELIRRLRRRFAPGGMLHYGQGKWYPGESLPRWALSCFWRTDGEPLWKNVDLLADDQSPQTTTPEQAEHFTETLAENLGVDSCWVVSAYEDIWETIRQEHRVPVNVDPLKTDVDDPEERRRLARVLNRGIGKPTGFVLPLRRQWWQAKAVGRWVSGPWPLRSERMFLIPGDSPVGLRLPLDTLPVVPSSAPPTFFERDPFEDREPLPRHEEMFHSQPPTADERTGVDGPRVQMRDAEPMLSEEERMERRQKLQPAAPPEGTIRTALCVEPRDGRLYVFMPPAERLEDYLELLASVESTAEALGLPVIIEGYLPPDDPRIKVIKVTPDPGVIEVNVQPAHDWEELVEITTNIYEDARQTRLGTEKFQLDGRHTGTGGGNHIVLGGSTPADSPFLRRPDLLRSLLGYWNNHPALSYLFSGMFIGPTSQAPRVDEGRRDSIYELELAFAQIPDRSFGACPPWLVDRVFRHLLTDLTGNTHRAEFCIDKLYSPDSSTGRLGLLEFRAFEMPPHSRMSLVQQLLVRALVARFWEVPSNEKLIRWGTALHDRFMLPHFLKEDFTDVIRELQTVGIDMRPEWFVPHFEFRCPVLGHVEYEGVHVELRQAIEPWYVLGEEPGGGGTARYVDSSVERLQVKATGLVESRHAILCNGRRVPLHPTGEPGEAVAGVRYRAWQPPSCLHPTIPVHTPLAFDIVDQRNGRSLGGCRYHVDHPGGLNPTTFPVNALEAESRRGGRFFRTGHTPGILSVPPVERTPDFPLTLDLRRTV